MIWLWIGFAISLLLDLYAFVSLTLWIHEVVLETRLLREQQLWAERMSTLFGLAISTSGAAFLAFTVYLIFLPIGGLAALENDSRFWIIFWVSTSVLIVAVLLWLCSLFLAIQIRRRPKYVFLLPQDAEDVRIRQCIQGMYLAITLLPKQMKEEFLDPFIRSVAVTSRAETFPVGKRQKTIFTNDFGTYCNLAVEASTTGYYAMNHIFEEDRERYERLEPLIKAFPDVKDEQKRQLRTLAQHFLAGETGETHLT